METDKEFKIFSTVNKESFENTRQLIEDTKQFNARYTTQDQMMIST